jgi:hypothetical protein
MSAVESEVEVEATTDPATKPKKKAPEIRLVTMEDGTVEQFTGKKRLNKYYDLDAEGNLIGARFYFSNGRILRTTPPKSLIGRFAGHGLVQKYGDELAGMKPAEGQDEVDVDDMYLEMESLDEQIQQGIWSQRKEGDGTGGTSVLIQALVLFGGKPVEIVKAFLKTKDAAFKRALRLDEKKVNKDGKTMAQIVKEIEAAKASKGPKVDVDAGLDELDAMMAS